MLNEESYLNHETSRDYLCQKLHLSKVALAIWNQFSSTGMFIKLILNVKEDPSVELDTWVLVGPEYLSQTPPMEAYNYDPFPVLHMGN